MVYGSTTITSSSLRLLDSKEMRNEFMQASKVNRAMGDALSRIRGFGLNHKEIIYQDVRRRVDRHIGLLSGALNQVNGVKRSERYWRIVFGNWLSLLIQIASYRFGVFEKVIGEYEEQRLGAGLFETLVEFTSLSKCSDFTDQIMSGKWNAIITYLTCFHFGVGSRCKEEILNDYNNSVAARYSEKDSRDSILSFIKAVKNTRKILIYKSYLDKRVNILLHLRLGMLPKRIPLAIPFDMQEDWELRFKIYTNIYIQCADSLDRFIAGLCCMTFPRSFLEAYERNTDILREHIFGKGDLIFTSNGFDADDIFQLFSAGSSERGSRYLIGQHGNNYCSYRHFYSEDEISKTANKFIVWGNSYNADNAVIGFNFKYPRKILKYCNNGYILILLHRPPSPFYMWDRETEFRRYLEDISYLLEYLKEKEQFDVVVRIHKNFNYYGGCAETLKNEYSEFEWDDGESNLQKLISGCRVCIHTYLSTGILETLNQRVPTLAFWSCGWELLRTAQQNYDQLENVKILFRSSKLICDFMNDNAFRFEDWWGNKNLQMVVSAFCELYSKAHSQPVSCLKNIITSEISQT